MIPISLIPISTVCWLPCNRLIATRYPTVGLYDEIADPADLEFVFAIEALTNPRVRQELGTLSLVPPVDRVSGPGATLIMAAFTHLNPEGSRFSDGSFGVFYAARNLATAIAEVSHHRGRFLARTAESEIDIDLRWIQANIAKSVHDIRATSFSRENLAKIASDVYHLEHYGAGQTLAGSLRRAGSIALAYDSVRLPGGQCVAVFVPRALTSAQAVGHLCLHWDGSRISHWFEKGSPQILK